MTRRTLYYHFADKEELARTYLRKRDERGRALLTSAETILQVFDRLEGWFRTRDFRGCALTNAALGDAETVVFTGAITTRHKRALRTWFIERATSYGADRPRELGEGLMLLFDGCLVAARTRSDHAYLTAARSAAAALLAAHGGRTDT